MTSIARVCAIWLAILPAGLARADDSAAGYIGNTMVGHSPAGKIGKTTLNADHSFSGVDQDGKATAGTWNFKGGQICYLQSAPSQAAKEICTPFSPHKVGDSWSVDYGSEKWTITLEAGH